MISKPISVCKGNFFKAGAPFFVLGDTAWAFFWRLSGSEAEFYLEKRAAQGFTTIFTSLLFEVEFSETPPVCGHFPFHHGDPTQPNEAFWAEVDFLTQKANSLGLTMAFLPAWGDKWFDPNGEKYSILTPHNARIYGQWLGERYRETDHLWVLGGDRAVTEARHIATLDALAEGLRVGDKTALLGFHPNAEVSPKALWGDKWLDFSLLQTGHGLPSISNFRRIREEIEREPRSLPVLDGEPTYEDHPVMRPRLGGGWERAGGLYASDFTVRKKAYHALFAGASGHVYGAHAIWQFFEPGREPLTWPRTAWDVALDLPGAAQMGLMRRFFESFGPQWFQFKPDANLLLETAGEAHEEVGALRLPTGDLALIYTPNDRPFWVNLPRLAPLVAASWFDPRTGRQSDEFEVEGKAPHQFVAPFGSEDAVLVLRCIK